MSEREDQDWERQWRTERDESREPHPIPGGPTATLTRLSVRDLIDERALAELLGVSCSTLQSWRYANRGPRFLKVGRLVRYRKSDVAAFLDASESVAGRMQA